MSDAQSTVREFYSALAAGNPPAAFALVAPDIEWTEAERSPYYAGTWKGLDQVVAGLFQPLGADVEGFAAKPDEFIAQGDRVAVLGNYSGKVRGSGRDLNAPFVHSWTVADGKLKKFVQYTDTAKWIEAFQGK